MMIEIDGNLDLSEHHIIRRGREYEEHHRGQPGPRHPVLVQRERQLRARGLQTGIPPQLQVSLEAVFSDLARVIAPTIATQKKSKLCLDYFFFLWDE